MSSDNKTSGATTVPDTKPPSPATQAGAISRWLAERLLDACGRAPLRITLWDGTQVPAQLAAPVATMRVNTRAALTRLLIHPDLYFGEDFMAGAIDVDGDLVKFLEAVYTGGEQADAVGPLRRAAQNLMSRRRSNSLSGSRSNIHHHYDIGNDFYQLWLDRVAMQYTCAYFAHPEATLEEAQVAKMDHVCRKLRLKPGEIVIEAGCGWGGLARHMARHYGVRVRAFNISHEQVRFARERAAQEGLDNQIEYIEDDYRNISGSCDCFVSVGMLEHVGPENYREMGDVLRRILPQHGRGLIHTIGRNCSAPMNAWIEKRIFPGARPPSLREMMDIFEHHDFSVLDVENLRLHYAETLRHWLERFDAHQDEIHSMFDERFVRTWRLYLAGSIASFTTGYLQLFQVLFAPGKNNDVPMTRDHLYSVSNHS